MNTIALLVSQSPQTDFVQRLNQSAVGLAQVVWMPSDRQLSENRLKELNPALIVIDVTGIPDLSEWISIAHFEAPRARIVIASALPNWQQARDAYQSGAVDCLLKTISEKELREYLIDLLTNIQSD